MITTEIFIENRRLDITQDISALLTFALDDIKDFGSRNTSFSKTIVLPGTANNNTLLGHIFDTRIENPYNTSDDNVNANFNPAVSADCLIFQDHIQVFKGTLRLLEIVIDREFIEYEVAVFGELGGLVGSIGSGKLSDLDFSAYDHYFTVANIKSSWNTITGTGYYYPLVDVGGVSTNKIDYDVACFRPALYAREYIDKIIIGAGYTWSSNLFNTSRFKSLVIPYNKKELTRLDTKVMEATITSTKTTPSSLAWDAIVSSLFSLQSSNTHIRYDSATPVNGTVRVTVSGTFKNENLTITFKVNGVNIHVKNYVYTAGGFTQFFSYTADITQSLVQNDYITCDVSYSNNTAGNTHSITLCTVDYLSNAAQDVAVAINDPVLINDTIPKNVFQKDFLASIIKLFNLYVYEDRDKPKKILIEPYVDYYDLNASGINDWTYKVDRSKQRRIKPMSELNSRFYEFKFKQDSDYYAELYRNRYNENYGDYIYDSAFEFTADKSTVDVIFSSTVPVGYAGTDKVVAAFYKKQSGVEVRNDINIRILQAKKISGVTSWQIKSGSTVLDTITDYGYAGNYDDPDAPANDLHFGVPKELYMTLVSGAVNVTQFNVYWSPYLAEITDKDSRLLTCYMKLTNKDIYDLDFSKLKYIDGVYWRLNKIEDYNASTPDVCKCEFLKVINLNY